MSDILRSGSQRTDRGSIRRGRPAMSGSAAGRDEVVVVTGAGGTGEAVARRLGRGRVLVLADTSADRLAEVAERLVAAGHRVRTVRVDVSSAADVTTLAATAAALGKIRAVVHTASV